jgi:Spy/CpxP family protein refolding chaperone
LVAALVLAVLAICAGTHQWSSVGASSPWLTRQNRIARQRQRQAERREQRPKDLVPAPSERSGDPALTEEERGDLRMVPPGVAFPRALIRVFRQLNLSNDQQLQLIRLRRQTGNQIPALQRLRRAQSELLDEALYGESFDQSTIEKRANDLAVTQGEIIRLQARVMAQIRQILTPEQGRRFRELLNQERAGQGQSNQPQL